MYTLLVLMWKHFMVRKRRFIATPVEFLTPCLIFVLMYSMKSFILVERSHGTTGPNIRYTDIIPLERVVAPSLILYTPDVPLTNSLMDEVGYKLKLPKLQNLPDPDGRGYYAFSNESVLHMSSFLEKMRDTSAVVIFQNMEDSVWPSRLNYTIRMKINYMTHIFQSLDDRTGPHENFGAIYEPFMRLQWAVDSSYLKLLTGSDVNKTITLHEFPYVDTVKNSLISTIAELARIACIFGLLFPYVFLVSRLLEERASGIQEIVRMAGVSTNTLFGSHCLNVLPAGIIYVLSGVIFLKIGQSPFVPQTNWFILLVMFALHFGTVMALALACSFLTRSKQYIVTVAVTTYVGFLFISSNIIKLSMPSFFRMLSGLVPQVPVFWFWKEVAEVEQFGVGITFSNMFNIHAKDSESVVNCYFCMMLQILLFFAIAQYLSKTRPGKYGIALPWNYVLQRSYWTKKKVKPSTLALVDDPEETPITHDPLYFEDPPANAEVGIKTVNVTKLYGRNRVLNNVSFDVYRGEITVLLGHNGAGKTTLMSIITGMINMTSGQVFVNGSDITKEQRALQRQVGLCTQENIFFPDLTVKEHVMFFSMLRGKTIKESHKATTNLLTQLGIQDKAGSKTAMLSGGMKRRLQLAIALAGDANVLILDEPTSGLDVETRRELWDLLLSLRGSRTVVLSTHFMEEADALGDRVIAIHTGTVRCHATPMYLKKSIGTGYRLSLTTIGYPKDSAITNLITKLIPNATIKEKSYNSISYNLPANDSDKFPRLFTKLEEKRSELGVDSIGVGVSTLEEVFLKLCSDVTTTLREDTVDGQSEEVMPEYRRITGCRLYLRQFYVLFRRQIKFLWFKKYYLLLMQIIIPLLLIYSLAYVLLRATDLTKIINKPKSMNLELYKEKTGKSVLYDIDPVFVQPLRDRYKDVEFLSTKDVQEVVLRAGKEDTLEYNKYLLGVELNSTSATLLYTTIVRHAAPIALNMLSNVLANQLMGFADGQSITTVNHPLDDVTLVQDVQMKDSLDSLGGGFWCTVVVFFVLASALHVSALSIKERLSGTRHIHVMSGCCPLLLWGSALAAHALLYAGCLAVLTLPAALLDNHRTLDQPDFIGAMYLVLVLSVLSFLAFSYVLSWTTSERGANILIELALIVLALLPVNASNIIRLVTTNIGSWEILLTFLHYAFPPYTAMEAMYKAMYVARNNGYCALNKQFCPTIFANPMYKYFDGAMCCEGKSECYICFSGHAPGKELVIMVFQFLFYMVITLLAQYGIINGLIAKLLSINYKPGPHRFNDDLVRAEKVYVAKGITLPPKQIPDALLCDNLHKRYSRCAQFKAPLRCVNGVSLSVKKGECFGLLGVNGAGKSTTFKMISAEETPTTGQLFSSGYLLKYPRENYLRSLGYCPQFFGLDHFMTGRDNLELLLTLRGLNDNDVATEAKNWIEVVGLEKYANILVEAYSGGCVRRLGTACGLGGGAPLTLLDEPTSGVDVSARRRVWAALRRGLRQRRAVLITSHSMDEMEALCDRIAIMSSGEIGALGSPAMLRAQHAAGHALVIKLKPDQLDVTDSAGGDLDSLKHTLHEQFDCTLKDQHRTMLHYHINSSLRYSELFTALESLKQRFPRLVEDYSVTETTLEEVFLSFAQGSEQDHSKV